MGLWKIWVLGVVITIVVAKNLWSEDNANDFFRYILIPLCIILVGGIADGWWLGIVRIVSRDWYSEGNEIVVLMDAITVIFVCFLTWIVGRAILMFWNRDIFSKNEIKFYFIVFIISTIAWSEQFYDFDSNWEDTKETIVVNEEERQLLSFCNIPVQNISGKISGSRVHVSGNISTSDEFPYWYANENDEGIYDSASAKNSKIEFIEDDEKPYVYIITYCCQEGRINKKYKKEETTVNKEWKEYVFYLPEAIMQYGLE